MGSVSDRALRVDLHVKVLDEQVVTRAKRRGLDVLVYAPHFVRLPEIQARAAHFSDDDLLVVPAREIFTGTWRERKHLLAVGLDHPVPDFISLETAMDEVVEQGAAVLVPHPEFLTVSLTVDDVDRYRDHLHAIETFNPKHFTRHNRRARSISESSGLPAFTSSYAHLPGTIGEAWTVFPDLEPNEAALIDALQSGAPRQVERRSGLVHRLRCTTEFAHLFYENTWSKFDRVLLSDREATHPLHPAYDGRFEPALPR